ncbi:MAG: amino acid permease [Bacteroides sp. SM23_62_1]|nr:MAG: amino acid permease [Bacteroides sp. SM23_62_1]
MAKSLVNKKADFGTIPVFLTTICTILGAILFLRFGYAVGHVGFIGAVGIIVLGHLVTIPTALAVAEIATNQKVLGGGAYYIISRSFGLNIGAAIGITLFLSQAISIAFYVIAFGEAFEPIVRLLQEKYNLVIPDNRFISIPSMLILSLIILTRGARLGMKFLYVVAAILFTSIIFFLLGKSSTGSSELIVRDTIPNPDSFFYVFTIIFPAFTGIAAGLGLSGDLKNPTKSIPNGTLYATITGMIIYLIVAYKLAISFSPYELATDQLIMQRIAIWGPIIPIGLAAASLSSALGSVMVAPRTLQAIGIDNIFPTQKLNRWFARGRPISNEPFNASLVSVLIAFIFVCIGELDFVAKTISMFFMVTYGAICAISLLEHFAADPSYRPTFRSYWYFSLIGAIFSVWIMFRMNSLYATISLIIMAIIYYMVTSYNREKKGLGKLFRGVVFQLSRQLQIFAQRADKEDPNKYWRPFAICISKDTFVRRSAFDLLRWISYKYGFGTYIHYIEGYLSQQTNQQSKEVLEKLINLATGSKNRVYLDTIISPSYTSAIAQVIQLSGISGKGNNMILFEFSRSEPEKLTESLKNYRLLETTEFDICVLNTSYKGFGYKREIHIWISILDYENANLMILLGYIILGHPEWKNGQIKIFAMFAENELERKKEDLISVIKSGRLPISTGNVQLIPVDTESSSKEIISRNSIDADLTIVGFRNELIRAEGINIFTGYENLGNILFVSSTEKKEIS